MIYVIFLLVINMKKFLAIFIVSVLVGSVFAFVLFKKSDHNIEEVVNIQNSYTAFQLGVYKNLDNAKNKSSQFKGSIIYYDKDFYRVYFSILKSNSGISKMDDYLKSQNINYYKKEININDEKFIDLVNNYEKVLINTADEEVFLTTNQKILQEYEKLNV